VIYNVPVKISFILAYRHKFLDDRGKEGWEVKKEGKGSI